MRNLVVAKKTLSMGSMHMDGPVLPCITIATFFLLGSG